MFIYWAVIISLVIVVAIQAENISDLRADYILEIKKNNTCTVHQCPMCKEKEM